MTSIARRAERKNRRAEDRQYRQLLIRMCCSKFSSDCREDLHKELKRNARLPQARCRNGKSNRPIANNFAGNISHEDSHPQALYVPWPCLSKVRFQRDAVVQQDTGRLFPSSGSVRGGFLQHCLRLSAERLGCSRECEQCMSAFRSHVRPRPLFARGETSASTSSCSWQQSR